MQILMICFEFQQIKTAKYYSMNTLSFPNIFWFIQWENFLSIYPTYTLLVLGQLPFILLTISSFDKCRVSTVGKHHPTVLQYIQKWKQSLHSYAKVHKIWYFNLKYNM